MQTQKVHYFASGQSSRGRWRTARPLSSTYLIFSLGALYIVLGVLVAACRAKSRAKPVCSTRANLCNDVQPSPVSEVPLSRWDIYYDDYTDDTDNFLWQDK